MIRRARADCQHQQRRRGRDVADSPRMARPRRKGRSFRRGPQPLADAVWQLVRTIVPDHVIRLGFAQAAWERMNLPWLRGRAFPVAVFKDELVIAVEDSQYHHELMYSRHELLRKLQDLAPEANLARLRFRLGPVPAPMPKQGRPPLTQHPVVGPRLPPEPPPATQQALQAVADPELRQAIAGARVMLGRD